MSRKGFNLCILVFLVVNDYIIWLFFKEGVNPLGILLSIQTVAWLIANAFYEADKQSVFVRLVYGQSSGYPFNELIIQLNNHETKNLFLSSLNIRLYCFIWSNIVALSTRWYITTCILSHDHSIISISQWSAIT